MTSSRLPGLKRKESVTDIEYVFPQDFETTSRPVTLPTSRSFPILPPPLPPPFEEKKPEIHIKVTGRLLRATCKLQRQVRFWLAKRELERRSKITKHTTSWIQFYY